MQTGKAIIVSAPSGAGKTTIVKHLVATLPILEFSVSACSRNKREEEINGRDYYFIPLDDFRGRIARDEFIEWQEVYPGNYYGTLKSEMERIWNLNKVPIFDVDVIGGLNLKRYFGSTGLAIFIQPPSVRELENRLRNRGSESEEMIQKRLSKAAYELDFANRFDTVVVNDDLKSKLLEVVGIVSSFINHEQ
jgi:guanylate kinase